MKIIVVGAGIVGLSVALALADRGHSVIVFDSGDIPNPSSASHDLNRMMRVHYGAQGQYARLAVEAAAAWTELERRLGHQFYVQVGACLWPGSASGWTSATSRTLEDAGINFDSVPQSSMPRFLNRAALGNGIATQDGGVLLADRVLHALVANLASKGVELRPRVKVVDVNSLDGVVRTTEGSDQADAVVVAVGAWIGMLDKDLGRRLRAIRSIAVYALPPAEFSADWAAAPCTMIETRESLLYAIPPYPGAPLKLAGTANLREGDPDRPEPVTQAEISAVVEAFRPYCVGIDGYQIVGSAVGYYADPPDKRFVVRHVGRTVTISGCGGRMFKFGPLLGADVADIISGRADVSLLDRWSRGAPQDAAIGLMSR